MDDFPLWMKLPIWILVGETVVYAILSLVLSAIN
jgi:hypothetical protein